MPAHRESCDSNLISNIGRAIACSFPTIPIFLNADIDSYSVVNDMELVWGSVRICIQFNSRNGSVESRARRSAVQIGLEIRSHGTW